jgi:hypothetical protein
MKTRFFIIFFLFFVLNVNAGKWLAAGSYTLSYPNGCHRTWSYMQWVNGQSQIALESYTSNCPTGRLINTNYKTLIEDGILKTHAKDMDSIGNLVLNLFKDFDKKNIVGKKLSKQQLEELINLRNTEIQRLLGKSCIATNESLKEVEESELGKSKALSQISLQLGASGGFSHDFSQPVLMPQLGFDATLGLIGFRADGKFFKTSPAFDINDYLDPIKSVLTISNLQETNSNILLGINPYLNIGRKAFSFQPGIGIKFLMQKGASATAVYYQTPVTSILKFPDGDANRNLLLLEPNIRVSFGKPGNFLRFYIEAGYTIPQGNNEFSYMSRSIPNVVDPRGNVDVKALLNSKEVTTTGNSMPAFASVGAGIEIKLASGKKPDKVIMEKESDYYLQKTTVNNYGINDDGIKRTTTQAFTSVNNYGINDDGIKRTGEPVPGAEVYVEMILGEEPIANVITDENGEFAFETVNIPNFPTQGTLILTITPSKAFARDKKLPIKRTKIKVRFKKAEEEIFRFTLFWYEVASKTQNKGCFAVSGKNPT